MFEWFNKKFSRRNYTPLDNQVGDMEKIIDDMNTVLPFPEIKVVPPLPKVEPPKEPEAKIFYRIGATDKNRVSFSMGMMEITMNKEGVQSLVKQLEVFAEQLHDEEEDE